MTIIYNSGGRLQGTSTGYSTTTTTTETSVDKNADWNTSTKINSTVDGSNNISFSGQGKIEDSEDTIVVQAGASGEIVFKPQLTGGDHNTRVFVDLVPTATSVSSLGNANTSAVLRWEAYTTGLSNRYIGVYVAGSSVQTTSVNWTGGSTELKIVVDGTDVEFYQGSSLKYTSSGQSGTFRLIAGSGDAGNGGVSDVQTTGFSYSTTTTTTSSDYNNATNVPDGSRFEETDTRKIYTKLASSLTHEDDFSSDNFTDVGSGVGVDTTNQTLGGTFPRGAIAKSYDPITALSDTAWVMRFKFNLTSHSGSPTGVYIGVTDTSNATDTTNTSRDAIMFWSYADGGAKYAVSHPTDTVFGLAYTDMTTTPSNGDVYYVELKRTSDTTGTCSLYNDSEFSDLEEAKNFTIGSGASNTGLDNILITNLSDGGSGGTTVATIENLKIYDGVTSAKDGGWKEKGTT